MTTIYYDLLEYQDHYVMCRDQRVMGEWLCFTGYAECGLAEMQQATGGGGLLLARTLHKTMVETLARFRDQIAKVSGDYPFVAVLVQEPLAVLTSDRPARLVADPCGECDECLDDTRCSKPIISLGSDGKPIVLPGAIGYTIGIIASVIGTPTAPLRPGADLVSIDEEPWWMTIPDFDEAKIRAIPWPSPHARAQIVDALIPN